MIKNKSSNIYFTKQIENDIIQYSKSTSQKEKNKLWKESIGRGLKELIDNVVQAYRFGVISNISFLKEECILYLITVLNKYDGTRGSKAFNYFTVITKHWFFFHYKKYKKQKFEESNIEDSSFEVNDFKNVSVEHEYEKLREDFEFKFHFLIEIESWKDKWKNNDKMIKIIDSISWLFSNIDEVEFMTKKGVYVLLREISGLETKDISFGIKKLELNLKNFKRRWNNGEI